MKIECTEWSAQDEFGDRDNMGLRIYSENEVWRVIQDGGVIEIDKFYINNHYDAATFFERGALIS